MSRKPIITAHKVKKLVEETGFGMMECKRSLERADGDYESAKQRLLNSPDKPIRIKQPPSIE